MKPETLGRSYPLLATKSRRARSRLSLLSILVAISVSIPGTTQAVETQPPSRFFVPQEIPSIGCKRRFTQDSKPQELDSCDRKDGEGLRSHLTDVPQGLELLESYQATRRGVQTAAYVGTVGVAAMLIGFLATRGSSDDTSNQIRTISLIGGASLALGSFVYSIGTLESNESKLSRIVEIHNQAKPDRPITLELKTELPF